jgi:KDO2-lipid IV(A) lauroyltransferase
MTFRQRTRPFRHGLALLVLRGFVAGLHLLPFDLACGLGAGLGRVIGWTARRDTQRMRRALALLPDPPSPGACWADLGRRLIEFALAHRALERVDADLRAFEAALTEGRGVLLCTSHLGNWELLAATLAAHGHSAHSLAARDQGGALYRWLRRHRAQLGVHTHSPGGGARVCRDRCKAGLATGILVDQNTGERGRAIPFLNRPAPTPITAERLVKLTGAVPIFASIVRDGRRYRLRTVRERPGAGLTERLTAQVDALVRAHPTQWVWLHDRWGDYGR